MYFVLRGKTTNIKYYIYLYKMTNKKVNFSNFDNFIKHSKTTWITDITST